MSREAATLCCNLCWKELQVSAVLPAGRVLLDQACMHEASEPTCWVTSAAKKRALGRSPSS